MSFDKAFYFANGPGQWRYKKSVGEGGTLIRRGRQARIYQKTFFDKFGNDPSCGKNGYF